nr:M23 family metallopeptidase [Salinimonas marina]
MVSLVFSLGTRADTSELVLNGTLTQGSLIRAQLPPGSKVQLNGETLQQNAQGKFVFGFDRSASLEHTLSWQLPDGGESRRTLTLTERDYVTQRIDGLDQKMVTPPEAVLKRIRKDSVNVAKARASTSDLDAVFTGFIWPAAGPITGVYGSQRILNGKPSRPHYGVDVGAPTGTDVVAPASGVVTLADDLYYSGNTIVLDHGMGVFSTFLHLDSMTVALGDTLTQGEKLGEIGATGRATGAHLDWRINLHKQRLDPALLVPPRQ